MLRYRINNISHYFSFSIVFFINYYRYFNKKNQKKIRLIKFNNLCMKYFIIVVCLIIFPLLANAEIINGYDSGLAGILDDDGSANNIPISFTFTYWGEEYTQVNISTNGWINLTQLINEPSYADNNAYTIPVTYNNADIDGCIAPFFDDLKLDWKDFPNNLPKGKILYYHLENPKCLIIQYNNMYFWGDNKPMGTFQVILFEKDNEIKFQYRFLESERSKGTNASIGIDERITNNYMLFLQDEPKLTAPKAISFKPTQDPNTYTMNENAKYEWIDISGLMHEPPDDQGDYTNSDIVFSWNAEADSIEYSAYTIVYKIDISAGDSTETNIIKTITSVENGSYTFSESLIEDESYFARIAISLNNGGTYENSSVFSNGIIYDITSPDIYTPTAQIGTINNEVNFNFKAYDKHKISAYYIQIAAENTFSNPIVYTEINTESESSEITYTYNASPGQILFARAYAVDGANNQSNFSISSDPYLIPMITQVFPYTGATSGQLKVSISGSNFGDIQGKLWFGSNEITDIISWSDNIIEIRTPSHEAGAFDVIVMIENGQKHTLNSAFEFFPAANWSVSSQNIAESTKDVTITVNIDRNSSKEIKIPYTVKGSAALSDHNLINGQITIPAGLYTGNISFQLIDDNEVESDETIIIQIEEPINAVAGSITSQTITILDNDAAIQIIPESFSAPAIGGTASFSITNIGSGLMSWSAISNAAWITILKADINTGSLKIEYSSNTQNSRSGTISITSIEANNSPQSIIIEQASMTNQKPSISEISDIIIDEDSVSNPIGFTVLDDEDQSYSLTVIALSDNQSLVANEKISLSGTDSYRELIIEPENNQSGTTIINLEVSDSQGMTSATFFNITVNEINDPPVISNIGDKFIYEDSISDPIDYTIDDIETNASLLVVSAVSSQQSLIPDSNIALTGTDKFRQLTITPLSNQYGNAIITLTVSDSEGLTAVSSFNITVSAANDPPVISTIIDKTINEDSTAGPYNFTVTDLETNASLLLVSAESSNQSLILDSNIILTGNDEFRQLSFSPLLNQYGTATITLIVTDSDGLTATSFFNITVNEINDPPVISNIGDKTMYENSVADPINFTIYDIETEASLLIVSAESSQQSLISNSNIVITGTNEFRKISIFPESNQHGTATITLIIMDLDGLSNQTQFLFTVVKDSNIVPDIPAGISPIDIAVNNSEPVLFQARSFYDQDGNESPVETNWKIARIDRIYDYLIEESGDYIDFQNGNYQEFEYNEIGFESGIKYYWQICYKYTGGKTICSHHNNFIVGNSVKSINEPSIPVGNTLSDFRMISFTKWPVNPEVKSVFNKSIGSIYDTSSFRIGVYDPCFGNGIYREYDDPLFIIEPGRSYWFLARQNIDLEIDGIPVSLTQDIDVKLLFNANAANEPDNQNGWNMIGCPNNADYRLGDLQLIQYKNEQLVSGPINIQSSNNSLINKTIWEWNNGEYIPVNDENFVLKKHQGYWVEALVEGVYLRFPHNKAITKRRFLTKIMNNGKKWIKSEMNFSNKAYADSDHSPPPPINVFIDEKNVSNGCFIHELINQEYTNKLKVLFIISILLTLLLVIKLSKHKNILYFLLLALIILNCFQNQLLSQENNDTDLIEPGRTYFDMGIFAYEDGLYLDAEKNFKKALSLSPLNPFYLHYSGKNYIQLKRYKEAQKNLDMAFQLNPNVYGLKFDLANLYFKMKDYTKSSKLFIELINEDPLNVLATYLAGISFFKINKYQKAIQYLMKASELSPNIKPNVYLYVGISYIKTNSMEKGIEMLKYVKENDTGQAGKYASKWIQAIKNKKAGLTPLTAFIKVGYKIDNNVKIEPVDMNLYSDESDNSSILNLVIKYNIDNKPYNTSIGYKHYFEKYNSLSKYNINAMSFFINSQYNLFPVKFSFYYSPTYYYLNSYSYMQYHQFNPHVMFKILNNLNLDLSYSYELKNNLENSNNDSKINNFSFFTNYKLIDYVLLFSAFRHKIESATIKSQSFDKTEADFGIIIYTPIDLNFGLRSGYKRKKYEDIDNIYNTRRLDKRIIYSFFIYQKLFHSYSNLLFEINNIDNNSNINVFEYDRQICTLSCNFAF